MTASPFLYPYTIRRSARARNVRLIVSAGELVVVVPQKFCVSRDLPAILESKKDWIAEALAKVADRAKRREETQKEDTVGVPETVELRAVGETWRVEFAPMTRDRLVARNETLTLTSDFSKTEALAALRLWVRGKGRELLPQMLDEEARRHRFAYTGVRIKEQKSLWGSCSTKGNINLNNRLLFMPQYLVRHVLLHELCHLKEMNHSAAFYELLASLDPNSSANSRELKDAWHYVPGWAML